MIRIEKIAKFIVREDASLREALRVIDQNKEGIVLVVDAKNRLCGIITDGDVRRFILKNGDISTRCDTIMNKEYFYSTHGSPEEAKKLMTRQRIRHIPYLGKDKKLLSLFISDTIYELKESVAAVVMAGGEGARVREISQGIPKPLLKIKEKPILEEVLLGFKRHHINRIFLALNYRAKDFKDYFRDGSSLGLDITYLEEKKKLGTAGALSLLPKALPYETLLVMNADVLTATNLTSLIQFYRDHHLLMCVAAKEYVFDIPFGIFEVANGHLVGLKEKPSERFFCNAGIYVLDKQVLEFIPKNKRYDMTDLIKLLLGKSLPIGAFPLYEYWIDIGNKGDFHRAGNEYDKIFKRREYE